MLFETPILLIIFNRPDTTKTVFNEIKKIKPKHLYIAADGYRKHKDGEKTLCQDTKNTILNNIDWDCNIKTLFQPTNLGCKHGPATAINWFFENEEFGIILEDDCKPDPSFFPFCQGMLIKYKDEPTVSLVSGFNALGQYDIDSSYTFSKIGATWGWATWKRAWDLFDIEMTTWPEHKRKKSLYSIFKNKKQAQYRELVCNLAYTKKLETCWDYQWSYARLINKSVAIMPKVNLISNIGFGEGATHHTNEEDALKYPKSNSLNSPLKHPESIQVDDLLDDLIFKKTIDYQGPPSFLLRIRRKIASLRNRNQAK